MSESRLAPEAEPIVVERWPSEVPLLVLVAVAAAGLWALFAISIIGIIYAFFIALFLFASHVAFIAHVRGSAVHLGPDQFPDLYRRVQHLAGRAGIRDVPEAYLMQAGGALNALATKFLRARMIVLYSDLLDACGPNTDARDMVIAHELGHIKAGHLQWAWLLAPGFMVPFLGAAYSRAREYTCDRYGMALATDRHGALRGLAILAAGGVHGPRVDLASLARQRAQLDTGWMTLGKWLTGHPPLCDRVNALEPSFLAGTPASLRGPVRALAILGVPLLAGVLVASMAMATLVTRVGELARQMQAGPVVGDAVASTPAAARPPVDPEQARMQADQDMRALAEVAEDYRLRMGQLPADTEALYGVWRSSRGDRAEPIDPFDGNRYLYVLGEGGFMILSSGPDAEVDTEDDISVTAASDPSPTH